jgi:hypothetical protein
LLFLANATVHLAGLASRPIPRVASQQPWTARICHGMCDGRCLRVDRIRCTLCIVLSYHVLGPWVATNKPPGPHPGNVFTGSASVYSRCVRDLCPSAVGAVGRNDYSCWFYSWSALAMLIQPSHENPGLLPFPEILLCPSCPCPFFPYLCFFLL